MRERERQSEVEIGSPAAPGGGSGDAQRARAEQLLAAGAQHIRATLSVNSAEYLSANSQEGGQ